MVLSMAQDVRVIVVKLADRLHNMRTLGPLAKQKQLQNARETLEVYAPIAHRLGIHPIKWELEDLAFATLHPRRYAEIEALVNQRRADREQVRRGGRRAILDEALQRGRRSAPRSSAAPSTSTRSTRRWRSGGKEFNEIFDLTAMRVLVDSVKDCYGAIGVIHALWKPMPGRFKDYVAMPKSNGYQSLHTTVIGPQGQAARDPGAHARDAPDRRVRRRRALDLQAPRRRQRAAGLARARRRRARAAPTRRSSWTR